MVVVEEGVAPLVGVAGLLDVTPAVLQQPHNPGREMVASSRAAPSSHSLQELQVAQVLPELPDVRVAVAEVKERCDLPNTNSSRAPESPADGLEQGQGVK